MHNYRLVVISVCVLVLFCTIPIQTGCKAPVAASEYVAPNSETIAAEGKFTKGVAYMKGDGVPEDWGKGVGLIREAAEAGHVEAMAALGSANLFGDSDAERDVPEAMRWYRAAAEAGHIGAMLGVVMTLNRGWAEPEYRGEAATLCKRAAA
ncbi:MAG: hypothetical protein MI741_23455 [Rhodospirillales bacterium]|nr:hypothetical protein [Rhodospirillales bacterium]